MDNENKVLDQNELVQLLPRQFSAIDFFQLVGDQQTFTTDQVAHVKRQAEKIALPGKVAVWDAVETACGLLAVNNMKHLRFQRTYNFPVAGLPRYMLTITLTDARPEFELSYNHEHQRIDHEIQHLAIPVKESKTIASSILASVRDMVREEEERLKRMANYKQWTSVEELITYMPRELTIGKFVELIQDRKRFTPEEVEGIIQQAANWADK